MEAIRDIFSSPWFRFSFAAIAIAVFVITLTGGGSIAAAFVYAILNGFFWSLVVSGLVRLFTRYR